LVDGKFEENPANGRGNGSDWQNQIRMIGTNRKGNYGFVRMDPKIFRTPAGFDQKTHSGAF
jgi:hypothetical protein